ncbi:MAG: hypothetical protein EHM89_15035 [Acidobacteria bacterium]|nr:MAG: hypothetical protein EHM89_15035 [Acidobacteriota bacterium]
MRVIRLSVLTIATLIVAGPILAQDTNITMPVAELERMLADDPLKIVSADKSRPKAPGDITSKAEVSLGGREPFRVKLRRSEPGAEGFNNLPRYDLAAYAIQRLLMDPNEYVMPPTALRMIPVAEFKSHYHDPAAVKPTFKRADEVLCVVQYWLQNVTNPPDILDMKKFDTDAVYARHIGQLNVFTYLIEHRDSNQGNFLISKAEQGPRVFSIDHGVAFASLDSDRGTAWRDLRVDRLPKDTVERVRALDKDVLTSKLGVLGQWELRDGHYVPVPLTENIWPSRGVRIKDGVVQMGLTREEISAVARQVKRLLNKVDNGKVKVF